MRCPGCQVEVPEFSTFCYACGAKVLREQVGGVDRAGQSSPKGTKPFSGPPKMAGGKPASLAETSPFEPSPVGGSSEPSFGGNLGAADAGAQSRWSLSKEGSAAAAQSRWELPGGDSGQSRWDVPRGPQGQTTSWTGSPIGSGQRASPSAAAQSQWEGPAGARPAPAQPQHFGGPGASGASMPSAPAGASNWALASSQRAASVPGDPSVSLEQELLLNRRRRRIHGALIMATVIFLLGAAFFFYKAVQYRLEGRAGSGEKTPRLARVGPGQGTILQLVEVVGPGRVDRSQVTRDLHRLLLPRLRSCFAGRGVLEIKLDPSGRPRSVSLNGRIPRELQQRACVKGALNNWKPPVPAGGAATLRIPLRDR